MLPDRTGCWACCHPQSLSARILYAAFTHFGQNRHGIFTGIGSSVRASDTEDLQCLISFTPALAWAALRCSPLLSAAWSGCDMPLFDLILGAAVALGLFVYLVAALWRPDRF